LRFAFRRVPKAAHATTTLERYVDEIAYRYDRRKMTDGERTFAAIKASEGKHLTYKDAN
jgi:hypothetical protein